jgi:hypothetical protein
MSKERPSDDGYQGDHIEAAEKEGRWARIVGGKAGAAGALGVGAVAGVASGNPFIGAGVAAAVEGVNWAGGQLARNAQDDHISAEAKKIDDEHKRFFDF